MRRLDRILGRHALDRLGVHIDDYVFGRNLRGFLRRRAGLTGEASGDRDLLERRQHRIEM